MESGYSYPYSQKPATIPFPEPDESSSRHPSYIFADLFVYINPLTPKDLQRRRAVSPIKIKIHNILSTAPQLSISQKALGTLPKDGNVVSKHVGATIHS
jgi:hypothetical protein